MSIAGGLRAKNQAKEGYCNVISHQWLLDCQAGNFRPLRPSDMIFATEDTQEGFAPFYDHFGDSFSSKTPIESLKYSIKQVSLSDEQFARLEPQEIAQFEHEHGLNECYLGGLFRSINGVYFHEGKSVPFIPVNC